MKPSALRRSRRGSAVTALAVTLASTATFLAAAPAESAVIQLVRVPVDSRLFLPCANGGEGEVVHFTGTILGVSIGTANAGGGFHAGSIEVEQGVQGIGETTGRRYIETFVNLFSGTTGPDGFPLVSTQQLIYRVNSSGAGFDSLIRIRNHTTINALGETTVSFDEATMECLAEAP